MCFNTIIMIKISYLDGQSIAEHKEMCDFVLKI